MGHQYDSLRNDLVDMGYSETFGAESASLIARLFADVCSYKEQCSDARNKLRAVLQVCFHLGLFLREKPS